jgi:hypothetical protein
MSGINAPINKVYKPKLYTLKENPPKDGREGKELVFFFKLRPEGRGIRSQNYLDTLHKQVKLFLFEVK